MNHLLIGPFQTDRLIEIAKPPFLLIDDGPIADAFLEHFPRMRVFNPHAHRFNPLRGIDYKRARDFAALLYGISPQGENTLTVRNGKRALLKLLLSEPARLDKLPLPRGDADAEAVGMIEELLVSPVLKQVFCNPTNFSFKGSVVAKLDRAVLGDFDALVLGTLLIGQFQGHIVVPDGGFYLRDFHTTLIRQNRLTVGLQYLSEVHVKLQQAVLSIKDKTVYRTTKEDAERLMPYINPTGNPSVLVGLEDGEYRTTST